MHSSCPDLERIESLLQGEFVSAGDRSAWEKHVTSCTVCRRQFLVAQQLHEDLGAFPVPQISNDFDQRLTQRIRAEKKYRSAIRFRQTVMRLYWLGAALISCLILGQIEWVPYLSGEQWLFGLTMFLAIVGGPILLLTSQLRLGLVDLVIYTVDFRY